MREERDAQMKAVIGDMVIGVGVEYVWEGE
jgi:hypothetical protein